MDKGHELTDDLLRQMERRISREYAQAEKEITKTLNDYLRRFHKKDETWRRWVADGKKTQAEYSQWRIGQIMVGERWEEMRDTLAGDFHSANQVAGSIINGYKPEIYALNHNYATFEVETGALVDTSYTLYDRQVVERLMRDDPQMLPPPGKRVSDAIRAGEDIAWNNKQIQSAMMQSILQGESIPKIATRLANAVGDSNRKAAIRNARTMTTGAENAGRVDGYKRAEAMGIKLKQEWMATLDGRTRHEHRLLNGQKVAVGESFEVEGEKIRFPGDPQAPAHLVYNCRCTLVAALDGFTDDAPLKSSPNMGGLSYEEWLDAKPHSNPILMPDIISNAMKWKRIWEYRRL